MRLSVGFRAWRGGERARRHMFQHDGLDDARMAEAEAALRPYRWSQMTSRAVALCLVEAIERDAVAADDGRVWMVERTLSACRWRGLTVEGVACQAAVALDAWHASWRRLEIELAGLLDTRR